MSLKMVFLGFALVMVSTAVLIGWYYQNGIFIGPYLIPEVERPIYFEFPVVSDLDQGSGNEAFTLKIFAMYNRVSVYEIEPISLLAVRPYPLSKSFPDPLSMQLKVLHYGPIQKSSFYAIGPNGAAILNWLIQKNVLDDISSTEVRLKGRKFDYIRPMLMDTLHEDYLPTYNVLRKALFTTSIDEVQKIVDAQPKHPQYWQNRAQLTLYRLASGYAWLITFNQVFWAIAGVLAFVWLWAFKSPTPFLIWWVIQAVYGTVWRSMYEYWILNWAWTHNRFWDIFLPGPQMMGFDEKLTSNLPHLVSSVCFIIIGPLVILYMGWIFLTKHLIPKQKRLFEDFIKFDKDKEKKEDLNITDVEFKTLKYDLRKKLEEYKNKPELFLGLTDDGKDVSIPEELANLNLHCMGSIGSGKTATVMLPLAIQALNKGYGACFIDLKGDKALIKSVQNKCKELGKKFYFFSIDPKEKTENYNPLASGGASTKVDRIMTALKLDKEGAAAFFSGEQRLAFTAVLKDLMEKEKNVNFKSVLNLLRNPDYLNKLKIDEKDVKGLISAISNIAEFPMINEDGIDLNKIMDEGSVVYFNLRPQINSQVAQAIGRMLMVDFKFWSAYRNEHLPKFFIFIDEFQVIASESFIEIISQVRNANYCLVLANQSMGNLLNVSSAFQKIVTENTHVKIVFAQFEDAKYWSSVSGSIRVEEAMMRMESGEMFNEDKTVLDGKRIRDGVVSKISKPLFSENTFLKLPKSKSVIFIKGRTACLTNHEFYQTEAEYKKMIMDPFEYEGGKLYGDPLEYFIKQQREAARFKKEQEGGEKKNIERKAEPTNTDLPKEKIDETNKNKEQPKKGDKNESSQPETFGPDGYDAGLGE